MKSVEELIALRSEAFDEVRRPQLRIAAVDFTHHCGNTRLARLG